MTHQSACVDVAAKVKKNLSRANVATVSGDVKRRQVVLHRGAMNNRLRINLDQIF